MGSIMSTVGDLHGRWGQRWRSLWASPGAQRSCRSCALSGSTWILQSLSGFDSPKFECKDFGLNGMPPGSRDVVAIHYVCPYSGKSCAEPFYTAPYTPSVIICGSM